MSGKLAAAGTQTEDITGRELCRMLQRCPVCDGEFLEHYYSHFAVTVLGPETRGRVREFFEAGEEQTWEELRKFQEFDKQRDAVVAYALRCSRGGWAVVLERSPVEHYETDRLIACHVADKVSGPRLNRLIAQNDWRRLNWT